MLSRWPLVIGNWSFAFRRSPREAVIRHSPFIILCLVLPALVPLAKPTLPWAADSQIHLYRIVELDWHLRHGILYPRVFADMFFGYSYPLFNFYAPAMYYVAELIHLLGFDFAPSLLIFLGLTLYVGALGAFVLARDLLEDDLAGYVAAAGMTYAPYVFYNVIGRVAAAEAWGLAIAPWVLWAYRRLALAPTRRHFAAATLLFALLILSHNLTALLLAPIVWAWAALHGFPSPRAPNRPTGATTDHASAAIRNSQSAIRRPQLATLHSPLVIVHSSFVIAFSLSAFFWVPALLETRWVQIYQAYLPLGLDYRVNFISLRELLSLPLAFDPRQVLPSIPKSLSLPQVILAAITGLLLVSNHRRAAPAPGHVIAFLFGGLLLTAAMTNPISRPIWERLPPLRFTQFPWRFLGPATLFLALLAGLGAHHIIHVRHWSFVIRHWSFVIVSLVIVFCAYTLPWTFIAHLPPIVRPTIYDLHAYELTGVLGTTNTGEYRPIWVDDLPPARSLFARYAASPVIDRLRRVDLPAEVNVLEAESGLLRASAVFDSPQPFAATFDWFYFPGWRARVDGRPAPIRITWPYGLISTQVPAGVHTVDLQLGESPLRAIADIISLVALLVLTGIWLGWKQGGTSPMAGTEAASRSTSGAERTAACRTAPSAISQRPHSPRSANGAGWVHWSLVIVSLALAVFRFAIEGRQTIFSRTRFDGQSVAGVQTPLSGNFGGDMQLMGLDVAASQVTAGDELSFALYWRALQPLSADYSISAQLFDANGNLFGQQDSQHPGGYPASRWTLEQYARDTHALEVYPGAPPGLYRLVIGVYDFKTGQALPLLDENGNPSGNSLAVAEVDVLRPKTPPADADLAPQHRLNTELGPLELVGADVWRDTIDVGNDLGMTVFWRAREAPLPDLRARVQLVRPDGETFASADVFPAREDYPTSEWTAGEAVRAGLRVQIPASAPEGPAEVMIGLVTPDGRLVAEPVSVATVRVIVPQRSMEVPSITSPLYANFQDKIALLGYAVRATDPVTGTVTLRLYWKALAPMEASYTVFVHLLGADGHVRAQRDSVPLSGARPTPGWLPGEILTDDYVLTPDPAMPPGEYSVEVGWYDAATGERLAVFDTGGQTVQDHVTLTQVIMPAP